ncbi:MAG TPA: hypothetical protein VM055_01855 [Novosphingobium sp.]|nr:hypothetical protein [Novosphingobium sp.]
MLASLLLLVAAETTIAAPVEVDEPNPKAMSRAEIAAFNAKLARTHPYYIRCRRTEETGSLVRKTYSCRTNEQWGTAERVGNDNARETVEAMKGKALNGT